MVGITIAGARFRVENIEKTLGNISETSRIHGVEIQVFDASRIFGKEHLEIAAGKAERAFEQGRNLSNTPATEIMLYAAAERQISQAIKKLGLREGIEELAIVIFGNAEAEEIIWELGWQKDDSVLRPPSEEEMDTVLEGMALSELER